MDGSLTDMVGDVQESSTDMVGDVQESSTDMVGDVQESSTDMVGDEQRSSPKRQRTSNTVDPLQMIRAVLVGEGVEYDEKKAVEALQVQGNVEEAIRQLHTLPPKTRGPQENKTQEFIKQFKKIIKYIENIYVVLLPHILRITNDIHKFTELNRLKLQSTSVFNLDFDSLSNFLYNNPTIETRDKKSKELNKLHINFYRYINFINKKLSAIAQTDVEYPTALENLKKIRNIQDVYHV